MSTAIVTPVPPAGVDPSDDVFFSSAEEFLDALSPRNPKFWDDDPMGWIHRGQANAAWPLQAGAARGRDSFKDYGHPVVDGWSERKKVLDQLLEDFRRRLEAAGIVIPSTSPEVIPSGGRSIHASLPEPDAFPLMALAQHHGLPTVLLDWTRRALSGALFAVTGNHPPGTTHLSVWSLQIRHIAMVNTLLLTRRDGTVMLYEAPGSTNPNLRAQSGLFSVVAAETDPDVGTVIEQLKETERKRKGPLSVDSLAPAIPIPRLRRTNLPRSEAPKLLRLLAYEGVDGAAMFPGADGVVRAMREHPLWDRKR